MSEKACVQNCTVVLLLTYFCFLETKNSFHIVTCFLPISLLLDHFKPICEKIQSLYCCCCESQLNVGGLCSKSVLK